MKTFLFCGILASIALATPTQAEPIAHWTFDTDFSDSTGNFNGTPIGNISIGQTAEIKRDNGSGYLELDGDGDYITVGNPIPETGSYTKLAWVRFDATNQGGANVITAGDAGGGHGLLVWDGTVRALHGKHPAANRWTDTGVAITADRWTHLAVTYESSSRSLKIYIDAMLITESFPAGDVGSHVNPDRIGAYENMSFWTGQIDDVQIWDKALSADKIKTLMEN